MRYPSIALAATLTATPALAAPPEVVTDIAPVQALVAQVMGDLGEPALLLDQGGDPHAFQLRPSQARALAGADLLFWVGPEMTPWLDRALEGTGLAGESVALLHSTGTKTRVFAEDHDDHGAEDPAAEAADSDDHEDDHADEDDHDHAPGALDPHAWLDPANAAVWVGIIAAHLAEADPENAAVYAANADAAEARLAALDARLGELLAAAAGRSLFVYHDAYGYFTEAYGLTIAGVLAEGDAARPGAAGMRALKDEIAAAPAACVFAEAGHDPAPMQALVEGTGLTLGTLDPSGVALTPGEELYDALMTGLAEAIAQCAG